MPKEKIAGFCANRPLKGTVERKGRKSREQSFLHRVLTFQTDANIQGRFNQAVITIHPVPKENALFRQQSCFWSFYILGFI